MQSQVQRHLRQHPGSFGNQLRAGPACPGPPGPRGAGTLLRSHPRLSASRPSQPLSLDRPHITAERGGRPSVRTTGFLPRSELQGGARAGGAGRGGGGGVWVPPYPLGPPVPLPVSTKSRGCVPATPSPFEVLAPPLQGWGTAPAGRLCGQRPPRAMARWAVPPPASPGCEHGAGGLALCSRGTEGSPNLQPTQRLPVGTNRRRR